MVVEGVDSEEECSSIVACEVPGGGIRFIINIDLLTLFYLFVDERYIFLINYFKIITNQFKFIFISNADMT